MSISRLFKDSRVIYVVIFILGFAGALAPVALPMTPSAEVRQAFNVVESLDPGDTVLILFDHGSGNERGNSPGADIAIQHILLTGANIIIHMPMYADTLFYWDREHTSINFADANGNPAIDSQHAAVYGTRLTDLGLVPGSRPLIELTLAGNLYAYNGGKDRWGNTLSDLPMMKGVTSAKNLSLVVILGGMGKPAPEAITAFNPYGVPIITFDETESKTMIIAYQNAGLLSGLVNGATEARMYEILVMNQYGQNVAWSSVYKPYAANYNTGGFYIGLFIIIGTIVSNIFQSRSKKKEGGT